MDDPACAARLCSVRADIADRPLMRELAVDCDAIVNFAAETHVDRSILEACRGAKADHGGAPRFLQVSTDDVYGSVETGESVEDDRLAPRSPYAAAKAAAELLAFQLRQGRLGTGVQHPG